MNTIRSAFYARVSSEQQAVAHTIESQLAALSERARTDGTPAPPARQFVDDGYSGSTLVRPALDRLRDLAAVGAVDRVYVHSPDRLARNYAYQVLLVDEWHRAGVELVFLNRPLGRSPEDDLLLQVQGIVADYERAKIMERSRRGKKHAAQSGSINVMSNAPCGYRYVTVHDGGGHARFEPVPEQARVVQQIFSWIGRDRCSLSEVCRRLQSAGQPTASGRRIWARQAVWHILQNPAYQGQAAYGKTRMMSRTRKTRPRASRPTGAAEAGAPLAGTHLLCNMRLCILRQNDPPTRRWPLSQGLLLLPMQRNRWLSIWGRTNLQQPPSPRRVPGSRCLARGVRASYESSETGRAASGWQ